MKHRILAAIDVVLDVTNLGSVVAYEFGAALREQKRLDLFDLRCQACGGLGVVIDLANRFYQCPGLCDFHEDGDDPESHCPLCEMVYGSKRCPECDGLGSPRPA